VALNGGTNLKKVSQKDNTRRPSKSPFEGALGEEKTGDAAPKNNLAPGETAGASIPPETKGHKKNGTKKPAPGSVKGTASRKTGGVTKGSQDHCGKRRKTCWEIKEHEGEETL